PHDRAPNLGLVAIREEHEETLSVLKIGAIEAINPAPIAEAHDAVHALAISLSSLSRNCESMSPDGKISTSGSRAAIHSGVTLAASVRQVTHGSISTGSWQ